MTVRNLSRIDAVYRSSFLSKYFVKGWGDPVNIQKICQFRKVVSDREKCTRLVDDNYPIQIDKDENKGHYRLLRGHFTSPLVHYLPDVIPAESHKAYFEILIPNKWKHPRLRPMCLQLAGTGDQGFWRRSFFIAKPLLNEYGIGSILLENPFYGQRKPKAQFRSVLHNVSDVFVMGGCLVLESIALLKWCEQQGYGPLALTGLSMGGHMASLAGGSFDKPVGIAPCLSWTTASCAFTQGVMSGSIPWELLQSQYSSEPIIREELSKMVQGPNSGSERNFLAGQEFARQVTHEMETTSDSSLSNALTRLVKSLSIDFRKVGPPPSKEKAMEAINFMRGIMDECTALGNFGTPVDPTLAICVAATRDAYVPRDGVQDIRDVWPGCEVRYVDYGHVEAFAFARQCFRQAIADSLDRTASKYYGGTLFEKPKS